MNHIPPTPRCSLHMLWNTQIIDTCVIFRSWHIRSRTAFLPFCATMMGLAVLYEVLRAFQKRFDARIALELANAIPEVGHIRLPTDEDEDLEAMLRMQHENLNGTPVSLLHRILRATLYGVLVFLSLFLMLVCMTYNAYLILSIVLGATLGHFLFAVPAGEEAREILLR
ncbi:Ctr copper transporter [Roridomyces roridus]|uniref:Copper transport protein n=1 Tax=Roridomyces roridus TaxID=1738132 RepID=A0AAD7C035_9AGAR|nr:Ctr copper transporter [Roridomyces roridus]